VLERVRDEAVDRYGQLPEEVQTLFAVASLRITCARLGVEEISTYRQQVRLRPLALPEALRVDLGERVPGVEYLPTTSTLNLEVGRTPGAELPGTVERALLLAAGEQDDREPGPAAVVATMPE
jgi:transcription-repair coupling factor (superfamily II helicase)